MKTLTQIFEPKQLHKTFLVLSLLIGTIFSLFMPLFNEPDGQYHLAVSGKIVNSIIDTSRYGEKTIDSGMGRQKEAFKNGTRFEKYYLNKAVFVTEEAMPRDIRYSLHDFVYWGHVVPAAGLFVGRLIYPSIGVMITVARLFSVIVNSLIIFFLMKHLKAGKLIYFFIFLSPVALNSFASLSYDSTGYVAVAFLMMVVINTIVERKLTTKTRYLWLASTVAIVLGAKWNYWILLAFIPLLELCYNDKLKHLRSSLKSVLETILAKKSYLILSGLLLALTGFVAAFILTRAHGGLFYVVQRYLMTFGYNYAGLNLLSNDITSWLTAPYPSQNYMPTWVSAVWYLMFFLVLFSEKKFVTSKWIGYLMLLFFFVGVFGVYYTMLGYRGAQTSYIEGVQGRYFTPTLLLLQVFASSITPRLNRSGRRVVPVALTMLVLVSNALLLFDTTVGLVMR